MQTSWNLSKSEKINSAFTNRSCVRRAFLSTGLCVLMLSGCGPASDTPETYEFSGTATHNGKPLRDVMLLFQPTEGRPSVAKVASDGKFTMKYTKDVMGVKVGSHTVYLEPLFDDPEALEPTPELKAVLEKYSRETSPYKIEVIEDQVDFDLKLD